MEEHVGIRIRKLRKKHNHTLKDLGDRINFNYSNLSKIERGDRNPTYELIEQLAELYDVPMTYFFRDREILDDEDKKWLTLRKESEDRGYGPEEIQQIIQFMESIRNKKK